MSQFVTYLTVYSGDKLPPFYIGSTSLTRISGGYHGSVRSKLHMETWKQELHDHPELLETRVLSTHQTRDAALNKEIEIQKMFDVVTSPMFANAAFARGGFVNRGYWTEEEKARMSVSAKNRKMTPEGIVRQQEAHKRIHIGRKNTPETCERMRLAALNRKKAPPVTDETRAKLSASLTSMWQKRKEI